MSTSIEWTRRPILCGFDEADASPVTVDVVELGNGLMVHKGRDGETWTVSHVGCGRSVLVGGRNEATARAAADALTDIADWSKSEKKILAEVRRRREEPHVRIGNVARRWGMTYWRNRT